MINLFGKRYNVMNMDNPIAKILVPIVLLAGGILFLVLGTKSLSEVNSFNEVSAVVSRVEIERSADPDDSDSQTVHVKYKVDGKEYNEILQFTSGNYTEGETVSILYDPANPEYVTGATMTSSVIFIVVGVVLALIGLGIGLSPFIFVLLAKRQSM